ncbi:polysaccharide pyruvyl transferase family protein [Alphaproteobacteria bacterium]|nr:polysaccharide pyruvyl transferase family protein [Alphaproteobacteria bacterium]
MIKVLIIGWYGTETIGDRAILAGLLRSLDSCFNSKIQLTIGSLYPFISERTIFEDRELYAILSPKVFGFEIIDSRDHAELCSTILNSDIVLMGGGPLMDLQELWMVNYAFRFAKRRGIPTAIAGCGVGPIRDRKLQKCLATIFHNADLNILRDHKSAEAASEIYQSKYAEPKQFIAAIDPAVTCALAYKHIAPVPMKSDTLVASVRQFPKEYLLPYKSLNQINKNVIKAFLNVLEQNKIVSLHFVPMCYHHLGVDDRYYMRTLKKELPNLDCSIQKEPLNLLKTMQLFMASKVALGMRFHSVLLQTILAESNIIFDYTGGLGGKISNFVAEISLNDELLNCVLDLQQNYEFEFPSISSSNFRPNDKELCKKISIYNNLSTLLR